MRLQKLGLRRRSPQKEAYWGEGDRRHHRLRLTLGKAAHFTSRSPVKASVGLTHLLRCPCHPRCLTRLTSARIVADGQGYRQSHAEPVLDKLSSLINQRRMALRKCRERHYNQMHEEIDYGAVNEAHQDGPVNQDLELPARYVVHRRSPKSDDEVTEDPQCRSWNPAIVRLRTEDPAGDCLRDADGLARAINQDGISQIEHTNDEPSDHDGRKRAWPY